MKRKRPKEYIRFDSTFIDGLRGLSALAVAMFHTALFVGLAGTTEKFYPEIYSLVRNGYLGVPIFIVLSGFVLMLPVLKGKEYSFPNGFSTYIRRRFRRLVPPYWIALAFSLGIIWIFPILQTPLGTRWDDKIPVTGLDILGHLLLLQNFIGDDIKINGPMWSVAIEWQIYFLFGILILPIWRWLGKWVGICVVTAISLGPSAVVFVAARFPMPEQIVTLSKWIMSLDTHEHYIFLFALGVLAAELATSSKIKATWFWAIFALSATVLTVFPSTAIDNLRFTEVLFGISFVFMLIWLARNVNSKVTKTLTFKPVQTLGNMSYSIYLVHSPLLALGNLLLLGLDLNRDLHLTLMFLVVLPLCILVAALFHHQFEKKFQNIRPNL
jgi:peptidoglycan/LPS O-acetylase OafA/YrhL